MAQFLQRELTYSSGLEPIVFFGTGHVSLVSLEALSKNYSIEAIITKPDTVNHGKISTPAVKKWAEKNHVDFYQPDSKKELESIFNSTRFLSRLGIVVDYGMIIPKSVIDYFPKGIINSHFSLLPQWRGADPITFAILSGQKTTGISIMKIDEKLDTGQLLTQEELAIDDGETTDSLTDKLVALSSSILESVLPTYISGSITPHPQQTKNLSYSKKITKADGKIDWQKPAAQIEREIRAYLAWPTSYTTVDSVETALTKANVIKTKSKLRPGTFVLLSKNRLAVATSEGLLEIAELKPAAKKLMTAEGFLAGRANFKKSLNRLDI